MVIIGHGIVQGSNIILSESLSLPEGTEVVMQIEPIISNQAESRDTLDDFMKQPCFGIWKNREDMADSTD